MLSGENRIEKDKHCMISLIRGIQKKKERKRRTEGLSILHKFIITKVILE